MNIWIMKHIVLLNWPYRRWWRNRSWCKMPEVILNEGEWSHNEWRVGCLRAGEKEKACSERRCIFKLFLWPLTLEEQFTGVWCLCFWWQIADFMEMGKESLGDSCIKTSFWQSIVHSNLNQIISMSTLLTEFFERPFKKWNQHFFPKTKQ